MNVTRRTALIFATTLVAGLGATGAALAAGGGVSGSSDLPSTVVPATPTPDDDLFDDLGDDHPTLGDVEDDATAEPSQTPTAGETAEGAEVEPEPGDDGPTHDAGDDHGGQRADDQSDDDGSEVEVEDSHHDGADDLSDDSGHDGGDDHGGDGSGHDD